MANDLLLDDGKDIVSQLLQQLVYEPNISLRLQAMDTLLSAIDDDMAFKVKAKEFKKFLNQNYMKNTNFMRQLKLYSKINDNVETSIEYHGQDYLTHSEYIFNEDFESEVMKLSKYINHFVGKLLKEYSRGQQIEF